MEDGIAILQIFILIIVALIPILAITLVVYLLCLKVRFYKDVNRYVNYKVGRKIEGRRRDER